MELKRDLSNVDAVMADFDDRMKDYKEDLRLDGKNIEKANMEQAAFHAYYDQIRAELESMFRKAEIYHDTKLVETIASLERKATKQHSDTSLVRLAHGDKAFAPIRVALAEIEERLGKAKSICSSFDKRGFALNNIVKINIAQLRDIMIYEQ